MLVFLGATGIGKANAEKDDPKKEERHTITFADLIYRPTGRFDVGITDFGFRLVFLDELRRQKFNVRGAENVVFGKDASRSARLKIGGTIKKIDCPDVSFSGMSNCKMTIEWQVLDVLKDEVVWKKKNTYLQRVSVTKQNVEQTVNILALGAFRKLLKDKKLGELTKISSSDTSVEAYSQAEFLACDQKTGSLPKHIDKVVHATVTVKNGMGLGSGFLISRHGFILTAAHVVSGAEKVEVVTHDEKQLEATVVRRNKQNDVALLYTAVAVDTCLPIATSQPSPGQDVFVVGAPDGYESSVARGVISGIREFEDLKFIQTDASVSPGNSGGPMVDRDGNILGVVSWKVIRPGFEGLGFGVPMDVTLDKLGLKPGNKTDFAAVMNAAKKKEGTDQ